MLKTLKKISILIFIIAILLEAALFFSFENLVGSIIMLYGWILLCVFVFRNYVIKHHPVIFMVSFGLGLFYFYFPLIGTLFVYRPLTYRFFQPLVTFTHQFIYITVYIISFLMYTKSNVRPKLLRKLLFNFKFYNPPTDIQLWLMGFFGVAVFLYTKISLGISQLESENVSPLMRFLLPMVKFIYAPILLLFKELYSSRFNHQDKPSKKIVVYIVFIVIISLFGNGRQFMISSIILVLVLYLFNGLVKNLSLKKMFPVKNIFLLGFIIFMIIGPFTKMTYAMLEVRGIRGDISAIELFGKTIDAYNTVELDELEDSSFNNRSYKYWDEEYTGNIYFDRLCNLKIADMTLYFVEKANMVSSETNEKLLSYFLAQIPSPLLKFLNLNFNKLSEDATYGVGSTVVKRAGGNDGGGKLVSGHTGTAIWLFGNWYPLFLIVIFFVIFFLLDSFVYYRNNKLIYSTLFLINIYYFFSFLNFKNGVITSIMFIGRPYIQMCILYILLFYFTRFLSKLISTKNSI